MTNVLTLLLLLDTNVLIHQSWPIQQSSIQERLEKVVARGFTFTNIWYTNLWFQDPQPKIHVLPQPWQTITQLNIQPGAGLRFRYDTNKDGTTKTITVERDPDWVEPKGPAVNYTLPLKP